MDLTERYLRSAADDFHQADMHLQETERYLRKLLLRLDKISAPHVGRPEPSLSLASVNTPVAAGS